MKNFIQFITESNSECVRGYHRSSLKHHFSGDKQHVMFGMYYLGGGTTGEMMMEWIMLDNKNCPRLKAYDDSWKILSQFPDVIKEMSKYNDKQITEWQFCQLLEGLDFIDLTCLKNLPLLERVHEVYSNGVKFYEQIYENICDDSSGINSKYLQYFRSFKFQDAYLKMRPEDLDLFVDTQLKDPKFLDPKTIEKYDLEPKIGAKERGFY